MLTFLAEWGDRSQIATIGERGSLRAAAALDSVRHHSDACCCSSADSSHTGRCARGTQHHMCYFMCQFIHPAGLAASIDIVGVTLGGILGHSICTGAAVLGGRQLATHIQERTVHVSRLT